MGATFASRRRRIFTFTSAQEYQRPGHHRCQRPLPILSVSMLFSRRAIWLQLMTDSCFRPSSSPTCTSVGLQELGSRTTQGIIDATESKSGRGFRCHNRNHIAAPHSRSKSDTTSIHPNAANSRVRFKPATSLAIRRRIAFDRASGTTRRNSRKPLACRRSRIALIRSTGAIVFPILGCHLEVSPRCVPLSTSIPWPRNTCCNSACGKAETVQ